MSGVPGDAPIDVIDHDRAIGSLKSHVAGMSALAVGMVEDGTRAFLTNDATTAKSVTDRDRALDKFDVALETEVILLIARIQPEGPDLRTLGAVLKIANCVDRVGRLGYDLARNLSSPPGESDPTPVDLLLQMDRKARAMVEQAVAAFAANDAESAKSVFALDDDVDDLYQEVERTVIELLAKGGVASDRLAHCLLAARHLERVGDNACKIAEKAVYAATGERRSEYFPGIAHRSTVGRAGPPKRT